MSHQTGIQANEELKRHITKCREGTVRLLKVSIKDEQLVLAKCVPDSKNNAWDSLFDKLVTPVVEENQPCYVLYRFDTKNSLGYEWLFISWSPDTAPVRQKMLYASTKATLKKEFGPSHIKEEIHGTIASEVTLEGYKKHKLAASSPAPLTTQEEELEELKKTQVRTDYGIDTKHQTMSGVAFPVTQAAQQAITDMAHGSYDYIQFKIDMKEEKIHVVCAENLSVEKLPSRVPDNGARYHLYKFKHTHEGDYREDIVFIYSMPGSACSIRERMLYSSCKNPFADSINLDLEICKKLEIDAGSELTEKFLYEEIHPTKNLHRPKFAKPKGPPGRGPKRMTRSQPTE